MSYIVNKAGNIKVPWEPGLLEWLQQRYPYSQYKVIETTK